MKRDDPGKQKTSSGRTYPPASGPGSGKDAWRAFAVDVVEFNLGLGQIIDEQSATIAELKAEIELLRRLIATRKPKGGRKPTDDDTVQRIEVALIAGASTRSIAQRYKVSAMTVSRIHKRMDSRKVDPA